MLLGVHVPVQAPSNNRMRAHILPILSAKLYPNKACMSHLPDCPYSVLWVYYRGYSVTEHPLEDFVVGRLVEFVKGKQEEIRGMESKGTSGMGEEKGEMKLDHIENLLLVDIRCRDLLLPYTSVTATFELQSSTLLGRLERFVARQEIPFSSTILSIYHRIRGNFEDNLY